MVSRLPPRARNRHVGFSTADLDFNNCGTSHGLVGILYSSRLILLYSNHLEGRQTVENHLVHIGTNSYRRTHVMTSSISILVLFFCGFYFRGSRSVRENRENLHPAKISRYTVTLERIACFEQQLRCAYHRASSSTFGSIHINTHKEVNQPG